MAENNLPFIIKSAAGQLAGLMIQTSVGSSSNAAPYNPKEDVEELRRMVLRIRATVDDAEERDVKDEAVKLWLQEIKDLAYDAEDIVDEYDYEVLRFKVEGQNRSRTSHKRKREEEVCNIMPSIVPIPDDFEDRIKKIRERFDEITHDRIALRLTDEDGEKLSDKTANRPPTTSLVHESDVYGRERDKDKVIELLLAEDDSSQRSVSVIPIIGMGGIGKTTLAQLVYHDRRVCQYFSQRGWVCVSENFDVIRLLKEIFESLTKCPCNQMNIDVICDSLRRQLNGKRFLLILDDVWNEKLELWEPLKAPLCGVGIGKIILTTRNEGVARIMQTTPPYILSCLPEDICWLLFRNRAFEGQDPDGYPYLQEIGMKIVRKCSGLPLAVKTLGGLLRYETDEERWAGVLGSDLLDLDKQKDGILPALKLSYIHMPTHLKRCFRYCSLFPKDYNFEKDEIVRYWMSQGFIQCKGRLQLEDIGNAYFEELIWRSFFQKVEMRNHYVMHDLLHDLAEYVASQECHRIDCNLSCNVFHDPLTEYLEYSPREEYHKMEGRLGCNAFKRIRHLGFYFSSSSLDLNLMKKCRDLRTLMLHPQRQTSIIDIGIRIDSFQNLTCLRTLDLSGCAIMELPDSIGNLKQLQYLGLRYCKISRLPDSVCYLYNLLVLDLYRCPIKELPKDMKNLIHLQYLQLGYPAISLPPGIGQITSLHTLSEFKVGRAGQHCGIGELKNLVHLRGHLKIGGIENVASLEDAKEAKMDNKKHLKTLKFAWGWHEEPVADLQGLAYDVYVEQMLENLRPHTNLEVLKISHYPGCKLPRWLGDPSYSKLVYVRLTNFRPSFTFLPALGQLPSLKSLTFYSMLGVRSVGREFCVGDFGTANGFPSLEYLEFTDMEEWVEWHGVENGDFPYLKTLCISGCPELTSLPACCLPSLKTLRIGYCEKLTSLAACDMPSLEELIISHCNELGALPALTSLMTLKSMSSDNLLAPISSSNLPSLQELTIGSAILESLTLHHGSFPLLRKLCLSYCRNLGSIRGLQSLTSLEHLYIQGECPKLRFSVDDRPPPMLQWVVDTSDCPGWTGWRRRQGIQYEG